MLFVLFAIKLGEAPFTRNNDELTARELELGTTESFESVGGVLKQNDYLRKTDMSTYSILDTDGHQDFVDSNTSDKTLWLTESSSHTSLETIGAGT